MAANKGREFLLKRATLGADVTFTVNSTDNDILSTAHGLTAGDMVTFVNGTPPAPLKEGRIYFMIGATVPTANTFSVALTAGGAEIDITATTFGAACVWNKVTALTTVAGLRSNSIDINNEPVDVTTKDDEGWRRLLEGVAFKSISMSAAGIWQTAAGKTSIADEIIAGTFGHYELIDSLSGKFQGGFLMSNLNITGTHDGVEEFTLSLESTGGAAYIGGT